MLAMIRRRPFAAYYLLAWAIALGVMVAFFVLLQRDPAIANVMPGLFPWLAAHHHYVNLVSIAQYAITAHPSAWLILVFAAAPSIAALAITACTGGTRGVAVLLRKYLPWSGPQHRAGALRAYGAMIILYALGLAIYYAALRAYAPPGDVTRAAQALGNAPLCITLSLMIGPFIDEGGTLEELGWRGFALPALQSYFRHPLIANLVLGALWMAWHLPRELPSVLGGIDPALWLFQQARFLMLTLALSVIAGWLVNRSGGSVLPAILLHGGTNVWDKALGSLATGVDLRSWIVVPLAVAVAIFAGRQLGLNEPADLAPRRAH